MRNVILTTMSTLNNQNVSYYYNKDHFCTGVSQLEAGTKYFLSNNIIDELIVVCSKETRKEEDFSDVDIFDEKPSPFRFFKQRINMFLNDDDNEISEVINSIEPMRRAELDDIINKVAQQKTSRNDKKHWFKLLVANDGGKNIKSTIASDLRNIIKEDIEKNFIDESDYEKYEMPIEELEDYYANNNIEIDIARRLEELEAIRNDKTITILGKEFKTLVNSRKIEDRISELKSFDMELKSEQKNELLRELHDANIKFIEQLRALKDRRLDNEVAYAKAYLYSCLDENNKMKPKPENNQVVITPIKDDGEGHEISDIIAQIKGEESERVNLYIDMQGGSRTQGFVRNAIISILNNEESDHINVEQIVSTYYDSSNIASEIEDNTNSYKITDLVAGMNAFIRYGKADQIEDYWREVMQGDKQVGPLVAAMKKVDMALSLCDVNKLDDALMDIKNFYRRLSNGRIIIRGVFAVLVEGIRLDYLEMIKGHEIDYIALIKWAEKKGLLLQALAIIEAKLPEMIVNNSICYYLKNEQDALNALAFFKKDIKGGRFKSYEIDNFDKLFLAKCFNKQIDKDYGGNSSKKHSKRADWYANHASPKSTMFLYTNCTDKNAIKVLIEKYLEANEIRNKIFHLDNISRINNATIRQLILAVVSSYNEALKKTDICTVEQFTKKEISSLKQMDK